MSNLKKMCDSRFIETEALKYIQNIMYSNKRVTWLNRGGYGCIYSLTDSEQGVTALKVMKSVLDFNINRALKEASKMLKYSILDCNIVKVHDVSILDPADCEFQYIFLHKYLCIEMEYYPNGSLYSLFLDNRPNNCTTTIILQILKQITNALKVMQEKDELIHNDIKPHNILLGNVDKTEDCINIVEVFLGDFGQAQTVTEANTERIKYSSKTEPHYPNNEIPSFSADVFALSMTIYEITTKKSPPTSSVPFEKIKQDYHEAGILDDNLINLLLAMINESSRRPTCYQILNIINVLESESNVMNNRIVEKVPHQEILNDLIKVLDLKHDIRLESQFKVNTLTHENPNLKSLSCIKFIAQLLPPEKLVDVSTFIEKMKTCPIAESILFSIDNYTKLMNSFEDELIATDIDNLKSLLNNLKDYYSSYLQNLVKVTTQEVFFQCTSETAIITTQLSDKEGEYFKVSAVVANKLVEAKSLPFEGKPILHLKNLNTESFSTKEYAAKTLYNSFGIETDQFGLIAVQGLSAEPKFIQVSNVLDGMSLESYLETKPNQQTVDSYYFSLQILGVLLTNPSNNIPNNTIIQVGAHGCKVKTINNNQSFSDEESLTSVLLLMKEMNMIIDRKVHSFITNVPIDMILLEWTNDLIDMNVSCKKLIKSIQFINNNFDSSLVWDKFDIYFYNLSPTTISTLEKKFDSIKQALIDNYSITLNQLFSKCYPETYKLYSNRNEISCTENYTWINERSCLTNHYISDKLFVPAFLFFKVELIHKCKLYNYSDRVIDYYINTLQNNSADYLFETRVMKSLRNLQYDNFVHFNNLNSVVDLFSKGLDMKNHFWIELFEKFRKNNSDLNWALLIEQHFPRLNRNNERSKYYQIEGAITGKRILTKEVMDVVFDQQTQRFKKDENLYGRSKTTSYPKSNPIFYLKKYPEFPGLEYASTLLMRRLGMHRTPHSELFMFYDEVAKKCYPVLIIEAIDGDIVAKNWHNDEIFNNLDYYETSLLILSSLLLNPEDQKEDNLILSRDGKYITPIDNDRNFLPGVIYKSLLNIVVNVELQCKSFVFCLNEMNLPFHETIIMLINSMDIELFIKDWLMDLSNINENYQKLFMKYEKYVNKRKILNVYSNIEIRKVFINNLYRKLIMIRTLLSDNPQLTPIQIMKFSEPFIAKEYSNTKIISKKNLFETITQKYYRNTDRISRTTINSSKMLMKIQCQSYTSDMEGPKCLLQYFNQLCSCSELEIANGTNYLKQDYFEERNEKEIIELFQKDTIFSVISLNYSEGITNSSFKNKYFLGKSNYIKALDLRFTKNLREETLKIFQENCNLLEYLNISGWSIKKLGKYKLIERNMLANDHIELEDKICFPKLIRLVAEDCQLLEEIFIKQDTLVCAELQNCPKLDIAILTSKQLRIFLYDGILERFIGNNEIRKHFLDFLMINFIAEGLLFYERVMYYKNLFTKKLTNKNAKIIENIATNILSTFISSDSVLQLGIPNSLRTNIYNNFPIQLTDTKSINKAKKIFDLILIYTKHTLLFEYLIRFRIDYKEKIEEYRIKEIKVQ